MKRILTALLTVVILISVPVIAQDAENAVIHNPIGGGRYEVTFTDAVDTEVEDFNNESNLSLIIGVVGVAVVAVSSLIVITIIKRKNR